MEENRKRIEELNTENLSNQILEILLSCMRTGKPVPRIEEFDGLLRMHFADVKAQEPTTQQEKFQRLTEISNILPEAFGLAMENLEKGQGMTLSELKSKKQELLEILHGLEKTYKELITENTITHN